MKALTIASPPHTILRGRRHEDESDVMHQRACCVADKAPVKNSAYLYTLDTRD